MLTDSTGSGKVDKVRVIARGRQLPVDVAFRNGDLYISAASEIVALRDIEDHLDNPPVSSWTKQPSDVLPAYRTCPMAACWSATISMARCIG
jgi:hypothetical protein